MALRDVRPVPPEGAVIPMFGGKEVRASMLRMTAATVELDDQVIGIDDIVRIVIEGRVTSVNHQVNERTGDLERLHTVRALGVERVQVVVPKGVTVAVTDGGSDG